MGVSWTCSARCPTSPGSGLYRAQVAGWRGQRRATPCGVPRARSLGNTAGRAHPPAGREHLLNSALSRQRGEFLGSGALLGVSREILGKASRPCPEWGPPHPLVPLNPLGSSHPPQRGDSERQPKLLLTSVPFPSWPLAGPAREAISWKAMSGPAFSWPHPPVLRAAHPLAGA